MQDSPYGARSNAENVGEHSLERVVESYLLYYASSSSHTARAKQIDLTRFLEFLARHRRVSSPEKLKVRHWDFSSVQRFTDHLLSHGEAPATVARRLATLKHMGRTLSEQFPGFINPTRGVKAPRIQPLRPKALPSREIQRVRERALERRDSKSSFIRHRNQILFDFIIDTGLRADEVRLLKLAQIDEKLEWISSVRTKGRQYRNVYITSDVRASLREYLGAREHELKRFFPTLTQSQSRALPLFISTYRAKASVSDSFMMGAKTLWRAIHELSGDLPLHPHLLRHSYALDLLDSSNDVRLVSQALGHTDVRVTMRYTERRDGEVATALELSRKRKKS